MKYSFCMALLVSSATIQADTWMVSVPVDRNEIVERNKISLTGKEVFVAILLAGSVYGFCWMWTSGCCH